MADPIHAFDFLAAESTIPAQCAVVGDEQFLKRLVLTKIQHDLAEDEVTATELNGGRAQWRDVVDELSTVSLFGDGPRVVVIRDADSFVSAHRAQIEKWIGNQHGCLILDLNQLASNTRLYKSMIEQGLVIECRAPQVKRGRGTQLDETRLRAWLKEWGAATHGIKLVRGADEELIRLVGPAIGLLDQDLAKLALFVDDGGEVTAEMVQQIVGGWRAKTTWDLFDAALDGNAAEAILQLERLLQSGEAPQAIAGGLLWSLRRFADAAQLVLEAEHAGRKITLPAALEQAGVKKWPQGALQKAERQLRQIGRHRASRLYEQLLRLDLSLKGSHSSPLRARWALEQLIVSLSREANVA